MKSFNLHILLTYNCSLKCKHCYVFSSPRAAGNISISQITNILNEARNLQDLDLIYFGGGEPFTQFPLLLRAVHLARKRGFNVGVTTNGYFARSVDTGIRFLRPLVNMGISEICISNDFFHFKNPESSPAKRALEAAQKLNLNTKWAFISESGTDKTDVDEAWTTLEVINPRLMFTGRAAETLVAGLPASSLDSFNRCPRDDLNHPEQIYIDTYGYVQICPGISIGNAWKIPLGTIIEEFDAQNHPILGSLAVGGPSKLVEFFDIQTEREYVDACHCCYSIRRELVGQYPDQLAPRQVYDL
jgi:hypothetical protein